MERNYELFSWAFLAIGIAFLSKIITNLTLLHKITITQPNFVLVVLSEFENMQIVHFVSFLLYKILLLVGFLVLFLITYKAIKREKILLFVYLGIITVLFSIYFNFIFHLTFLIILFFLIEHFYKNYKKVKSKNSFLVLLAFILIALSNIVGTFYEICDVCYVGDELFLLAGFLTLLINHLNLQNDKKKNKTGGNPRHSRATPKK